MIINFEAVFKRLDEELDKIDQYLELICAGGYVLQRHGYRNTLDVDAFYKSNEQISAAIRKIGDEFGINKEDELWLNNSISNLNPEPPIEHCGIIYKFNNLIVKEVSLFYLIGMKFHSQRYQDLQDISSILLKEENKDPFDLFTKLKNMGFDIDVSLVLEVFEIAYGIEWLADFYNKNSNDLYKYF